MNGYALATRIVHYSQGPDFSAIKELIRDKIHAPALMNTGEFGTIQAVGCCSITPRAFATQVKPFQTIQTVYSFMIVPTAPVEVV